MIPVTTFADQIVAVLGLGGAALATAKALVAGGAHVVGWDDKEAARKAAGSEGVEIRDLRDADWSRFAALVLAPGVPLTHPKPHWSVERANASGVEIIGDIELFCRERRRHAPDCCFIAITGTNGKSTTTALTAHILRQAGFDVQMGGNIGVPILALEQPAPERVYVIEVSSYQVDLAPTLDPTIGVLLNITPDHIDRHGTFEHYAEVKERLVAAAEYPIVSVDAEVTRSIHKRVHSGVRPATALSLVPGQGDYRLDGSRVRAPDGTRFELAGIASLRGTHNAQNAMAAVAATRLCSCGDADIEAGLKSFPGLAHRMEQVGRLGNVVFVNDSKATNADSTEKALLSWQRDIYWIAGGQAKEGGIEPLTPLFSRIAKAYLIGEAAADFAAVLENRAAFELSGTLEAALAAASRDAARAADGEAVVLLSPACASFDQFKNFEDRGDVFRRLVATIPGVETGASGRR
ncbi:MAG: hypothetical protein RLZ98_3353 [Pseudomonadota bacterium]|jgi:UDP-N-acetylmuramoylalanine--D-glutamate ligase